ncbi:hypothetical protein ABFS82_02G125300 [Erythranthe guttata]|nr:PREDICTED: uncharacterized protein LOC105969407 [Erythranthe guttata]|eukprot:XP_012849615.1 PREDICTED: uncharacterized protein LOC105969407 [Erythranthe guttata]
MGNPNAVKPSDQAPATTHFSHPHPLQLVDPQTLTQFSHCSACKLDAAAASGAAVYACRTCNFILHQKCYQLPQQINHPFDKTHALVLQPKPVYAEGVFRCDACGNQGAEFPHRCHNHPLSLTFTAPYPGNKFSCDLCKKITSNTWMYRCSGCEFDVHVTCVAKVIPPPRPLIQQPALRPMITARSVIPPPQNPQNMGAYNNMPQQHQGVAIGQPYNNNQHQFVGTPYPAAAGVPPPPQYSNINQPAAGHAAAGRPVNGGGMRNQVIGSAVEGAASGVAQAVTGVFLQEVFGLGGGGGGGGGGGVFQLAAFGIGGGSGEPVDGGGDCGGGDYAGGDVAV